MPKRRASEYSKAVAAAERAAHYFSASPDATPRPRFPELERRISELALAWRDMSPEEKEALKKETIRKAKCILRPVVPRAEKSLTQTIHIDPAERTRQLDALYRVMSIEQRAEYGRRAEQRL